MLAMGRTSSTTSSRVMDVMGRFCSVDACPSKLDQFAVPLIARQEIDNDR